MHNLSSQTRTFVLVLFFALISAYGALALNSRLNWLTFPIIERVATDTEPEVIEENFNDNINAQNEQPAQLVKFEDPEALKLENWIEYDSNQYTLTFKHPRTWLVTFKELDEDYDLVEIQPANGPTMKIYISTANYFALDGLQRTTTTVGNRTGFTIDNIIYGVKVGTNFFTLDNAENNSYNQQFAEIVKSLKL